MTAHAAAQPAGALRLIASDIKLAHSVFAMPFALLGAFMAGRDLKDGTWHDGRAFVESLVLVVLCMVLARTVAMLANRLLDWKLDQRNPRTAGRAIPSGKLTVRAAVIALVACVGLFMLVCTAFGVLHGNWWPTILGLPVLAWISAYPLLKRITWLCHVYLGSSLAISPVAAAIAVQPEVVLEYGSLWCLSGAVLCWVAGFDIIYALQDVEIDRRDGLHSIPARLGINNALWLSRLLHVVSLVALVACQLLDPRFEILFGVGIALCALLLAAEHIIIATRGLAGIHMAFFTLNGIVSCVLGALGIIDILVK